MDLVFLAQAKWPVRSVFLGQGAMIRKPSVKPQSWAEPRRSLSAGGRKLKFSAELNTDPLKRETGETGTQGKYLTSCIYRAAGIV